GNSSKKCSPKDAAVGRALLRRAKAMDVHDAEQQWNNRPGNRTHEAATTALVKSARELTKFPSDEACLKLSEEVTILAREMQDRKRIFDELKQAPAEFVNQVFSDDDRKTVLSLKCPLLVQIIQQTSFQLAPIDPSLILKLAECPIDIVPDTDAQPPGWFPLSRMCLGMAFLSSGCTDSNPTAETVIALLTRTQNSIVVDMVERICLDAEHEDNCVAMIEEVRSALQHFAPFVFDDAETITYERGETKCEVQIKNGLFKQAYIDLSMMIVAGDVLKTVRAGGVVSGELRTTAKKMMAAIKMASPRLRKLATAAGLKGPCNSNAIKLAWDKLAEMFPSTGPTAIANEIDSANSAFQEKAEAAEATDPRVDAFSMIVDVTEHTGVVDRLASLCIYGDASDFEVE
ncbi:unnamed protein product, partial [Prorocentrum cordatum]